MITKADKDRLADKLGELIDLLPGAEGRWSADHPFYDEWRGVLFDAARALRTVDKTEKVQDVAMLDTYNVNEEFNKQIAEMLAMGYRYHETVVRGHSMVVVLIRPVEKEPVYVSPENSEVKE